MANQKPNLDYLRFNALSMKDALTKKLAEDPNFTDMIFEDSNLSIIIDIFSQMYQTLLFYVNKGAAESLFTDTNLYENMNRLVEFIGYNPRGYTPAAVGVNILDYAGSDIEKVLPKYSYIAVQNSLNNAPSNLVYYSTTSNNFIYNTTAKPDAENLVVFYEGFWKLYEKTFVANGNPFETIVLENLYSDSERSMFTSLDNIDVFVKRYDSSGNIVWLKFRADPEGLYIRNNNTTYNSSDRVFQSRLNEYKQIELKFGDGINGELLRRGDELYIVYLKSQGPSYNVGAGWLNSAGTLKTGIAGLSNTIFNEIFSIDSTNWLTTSELATISTENSEASSIGIVEETVDEIRESAPKWFRRAGKLTTQSDFHNYILSNFRFDIVDLKVFNNFGYMNKFFGWLYNLERQTGNTYITKELRTKYDFPFADAADSNNVYACIKFKDNVSINKKIIERRILPVKPLTSEMVFLDPLDVKFIPCAFDIRNDATRYDIFDFDSTFENYIEVLVSDETVVSPENVKARVEDVIQTYFSADNQKLGSIVDLNELHSKLMELDGVARIRTVFKDADGILPTTYINGLSFVFWTPRIVEGDDLDISTGTVHLEDFQFPTLITENFANRIKVIVENIYPLPLVEY